ncbi:MAG TPA: GntR family transcriptional regulator [Longimicrobium sp.]|jgi:GntR family transcriptional regulator|uniref:GntR family transcriptional regulator n=1 Tax=Longimicrobium sp. TaxID=2029185 RepID=UPI002ED9773F
MFTRPAPGSGVPIYLQLMQQVRHALETGALRAGDQLPGIRVLAEALVINANTVAKAYRELEHEGVLELRHGAGAFVAESTPHAVNTSLVAIVQPAVRELIDELASRGFAEAEIRRLVEAELARRFGVGTSLSRPTRNR